ncbi:carbohydrate ABC transporter permease [Paenibacillus massiliensis]|uniref:carbohydrate ABC transporter permease n=1 Tax=Paenibacillus massiliensis TaxID=225917 RepID=UPI000376F1B7|nr:carbohydrate ABC transporter permease [Paenibacillus massiliensis]
MMQLKPAIIGKNLLLILMSFTMVYPIIWLLLGSFKANNEIFTVTSLWPTQFHFSNYAKGWDAVPGYTFGNFIINSLTISLLSVVGCILSSSLVAFPFARMNFPLKKLWFSILLGTLMLPTQVLLIPRYVMFSNLGWINTILPLVLPYFLASNAFFVYLMIQFLRGLPRDLDEAALMDGCGPFRTFFSILLPNCKPVLYTMGIFSFLWSWDDYFDQLLYLNEVRKYTVPLALQMFVDNAAQINWGSLFAMSIVAIIPPVIIFFIAQKHFVEGVATSGIK